MGEPFVIDFIKTPTGDFTNVIYITAGARAPGKLLARGRQATETWGRVAKKRGSITGEAHGNGIS